MKNKILLSLLLTFGFSGVAQAAFWDSWFDNYKDEGRDELKGQLTEQLDQYCLKVPYINYYLCPPISPDWLDNVGK